VAIATPNHWHALATIWACQAGKDVYVEKPFSYNIWEGRQMVAAARKYKRMVQVGTQRRSSLTLRQVVEFVRGGQLGAIRCAYALVYRARDGIGKVTAPTPIPDTINYDLWCGPAQVRPVMRKQLHYEWHWQWPEGNGEIGNNGAHHIDIARWALGQDKPAPRAMSIGGRLGFDDDGETPNTQVAFFDYRPAPLVCEIRNYRGRKDAAAIGKFRGQSGGIIIDCEGGYVAGDMTGCTVFDTAGKEIKKISDGRKSKEQEEAHAANFVEAMRSRDHSKLNAEAQIGHVTATCCHMANVSHRLGTQSPPETIAAAVKSHSPLSDAFERCRAYLQDNGLDLHKTQATLGPWLTLEAEKEQFVGQFADQANELSRRSYREPFIVPELA
jgi:predicted dehydrogenase